MKSIEGIRQRCKDANDPLFYDRMYVLQVSTAGYSEWLDTGIGALCRSWTRQVGDGKADIPDYPMIDPGEQLRGVANYMLVNDRIAVANTVLTLPEIHLKIDDLTEREIGEKHFEDSWIEGEWSEEVKMCGMDLRSCGIGWAVCGPNDAPETEQTAMWIHVDPLDMLFDRGYKSPGRWRWFCYRERIPIDDAVEKFGHIFNQDIASGGKAEREALAKEHGIRDRLAPLLPDKELSDTEIYEFMKLMCVRRVDPLNRDWFSTWANSSGGNLAGQSNVNDYVLHVWHYWDGDHHMIFLGSIDGGKSIPVTYRQVAGNDSAWNYQIALEAGPNPYGTLPCAWWIGNWASGMMRPTPISETVKPLADAIRWIDALVITTIKRSLPMVWVNNAALDTQSVEFQRQWDKAVKSNDVMAHLDLTFGVDVKEAIGRLDVGGGQAISEWMEARANLKAELDAATGVSGAYRGQGMGGGEKSRKEATSLLHAADTQQRDMRNQYAMFLERMVKVTRTVASIVDNKPRLLMLDDGPVQINGNGFPISQFISKPAHVYIDPNDTIWRPKEEVQAEALAEWKEHQVMIQLGQISPRRACENFLAKFGGRKAMKLLYTDKELQQNQQAKAQQAQTAAVQQLIERIKIELGELPDQLKQAIFEASGLLPKGTPIDWGPNSTEQFEAQVEVTTKAADIAHEQRMAALDRVHEAAARGHDHAHERRMAKEKSKPAPATNGRPKR